MDLCILCNNNIEEGGETVTLRQKGADSINAASKQRGDELEARPGLVVHKSCRLDNTNARSLMYLRKRKEKLLQNQSVCCVQKVHFTSKQIVFSVVKQQNQVHFMTKVK